MKVHAVVPQYPPHSLVGSWVSTHEFMRHLVERGHTVQVTAYRAAGAPRIHEGVEVLTNWGGVTRPDVVVGHAGDDGSARATAHRFDVPLVMMVHGGRLADVPQRVAGADLVVFNSRNVADTVATDLPSVVCPPPIKLDAYRRTPGEFVTLVNLSLDKGGATFWELATRMPTVKFLGVQGAYGKQLLRGGLPNVHVIRTTANIADDVYAKTRVLLMPSQSETFGRVAVEAGASGIPVLSSRTPGVEEALGPAATYVDLHDVDAWQHALVELLDPVEWQRASRAVTRRLSHWRPSDSLHRFTRAVERVVDHAGLCGANGAP